MLARATMTATNERDFGFEVDAGKRYGGVRTIAEFSF
jgi:hypothetical protein